MRSQDTVFVIGGTTRSVDGRELAWKFMRDNWPLLYDRYRGIFLLARLVKVRHAALNCTVSGPSVVHETAPGTIRNVSVYVFKNYLFDS